MSKYIGLDIGSVSADLVVLDERQRIHETRYVRTYGRPMQVALEELQDLQDNHPGVEGLAVTGSGAERVGELLEVPFVNEIMAQSRATAFLHPDVRTIIEIGGEDSKMIQLEEGEDDVRVGDFVMNALCSAGTGSFLDQQASRLDVSIEEFSQLALKSENPPRVAGRCSVFAKTDMIHLQQQGTPDYDIIAGLCFAMARNFKSNVAVGKEFIPPVAFQGGVAANEGMVRAFREVLGLDEEQLIIPEYYGCTGAIGAVLHAMENELDTSYHSLEPLAKHLEERDEEAERLPPLEGDGYEVDTSCTPIDESETPIDAYVGVDIGSISTNVVALDEDGNVIARRYLMTEGRPIEAVKEGLYDVGQKIGDKVNVKGCTTTGSGRYLIGEFVGADLIKNEISTHARGATHMDPDVDTIFEIGGQDAKYISLENGAVVDFAMNKVCAAGTGSFLEEQAERLGLDIVEEFGQTALSSDEPVLLGDRCTVFMESDINYHRQRGLPTDDIVSGLCYSIVYNYLNRVVEDREVGDHIFFQGGTAFNRGVKAAFENVTGKKVEVPPHQDILGAIGAALTAQEEAEGETNFRGFDLRHLGYDLSTFECQSCSNRCEIHKVSIEGQDPLFYGSRCGKYDSEGREDKAGADLPRLFEERRDALETAYEKDEPDDPAGITVGIPRIATFFDLYPLWKAFFTELGCDVELSTPTNKDTISEGKEWITAETCLPIHVAHGHMAELLKSGSDFIFVPSVVNMEEEADRIVHSYVCPLVQSLPYTMRAAFELDEAEPDLLDPTLHFEEGREAVNRRMKKLAKNLGFSGSRAEQAMREGWAALDRFRSWLDSRGREALDNLDEDRPALVIVSRSYNGCDAGMNLGIPDKLRDLGVQAIPLDLLPLDVEGIQDEFPHMYWKYGQKIIAGAKHIAEDDRLNAVYITNFRCGPDAFISKFFDRVMGDKPFLTLEVDEHTADVGAITRCEAFLDSLENFSGSTEGAETTRAGQDLFFDVSERAGDIKVYIPYMDDHGSMMAAIMRSNGIDAEAMPMSDSRSLELGRQYTSGDECYPCILTTGDIVKQTEKDDFDPQHSAFFMAQANGPCRFGQYHKFHRMVLDDLGYEDVPIVVLDQTEEFSDHVESFGADFYRMSWDLLVIVDFMQKMVREIRPYEVNEGQTDRVYQECLQELAEVAERKGDYFGKAEEIKDRLKAIPVDRSEKRPVIGVVGEIYVRSNDFANNFLIRTVEEMGGQVMMPTLQEWLNYISWDRREVEWQEGNVMGFVKEWIAEFYARWDERKAAKIFEDELSVMPREAPTSEVIDHASPYIHPSVKGEAVLSLGRAVEYAHHGLNGVINVAPFGCMPGAIVNGLLEKFHEEHDGMPVLKMAFDGQEQASDRIKLSAFVDQARQHMEGLEDASRKTRQKPTATQPDN